MKKEKISLNDLVDKGIITSEILDNIKSEIGSDDNDISILVNKNKNKSKSKNKYDGNVLNIIAAILIVLGVIWLLASNWSAIPDMIKIVGAFALMIASMYGVVKTKGNVKYEEVFSVLYAGFTIANISLISQTFHVMGNMDSFYWICLFIVAFIPLYSKSYLLEIIYLVLGTSLVASRNTIAHSPYEVLMLGAGIVLYSKIVLSMYLNKEDKVYVNKLNNALLLFAIIFSLMYTGILGNIMYTLFPIIFLTYVLADMYKLKLLKELSIISMIVAVLVNTDLFFNNWYVGAPFEIVIYYAVVIGIGYLYFRDRFKSDKFKTFIFMLLPTIITIIPFICALIEESKEKVSYSGFSEFVFFSLLFSFPAYLICFGISEIRNGIVYNRKHRLMFGQGVFVLTILRYLFVSAIPFNVKGIAAILIAIAIIFINKKIESKSKKGAIVNEEEK